MNNFAYILERLSTRAKNALIAAQLVSEQLHHDHIGTEHLLYGIISEKSSFAAEVLLKNKVSAELIHDELEKVNQNQNGKMVNLNYWILQNYTTPFLLLLVQRKLA